MNDSQITAIRFIVNVLTVPLFIGMLVFLPLKTYVEPPPSPMYEMEYSLERVEKPFYEYTKAELDSISAERVEYDKVLKEHGEYCFSTAINEGCAFILIMLFPLLALKLAWYILSLKRKLITRKNSLS